MKNINLTDFFRKLLGWVCLMLAAVVGWFGCQLVFSNWIEIKSFVRELF